MSKKNEKTESIKKKNNYFVSGIGDGHLLAITVVKTN